MHFVFILIFLFYIFMFISIFLSFIPIFIYFYMCIIWYIPIYYIPYIIICIYLTYLHLLSFLPLLFFLFSSLSPIYGDLFITQYSLSNNILIQNHDLSTQSTLCWRSNKKSRFFLGILIGMEPGLRDLEQ